MRYLVVLIFALLASVLPASDTPDIGEPIATTAVAEGMLTLHERGFVLNYLDGSTLTTSFLTGPPVLTASWQHNTGNGVITIVATYVFPVQNPTAAQRRLYAERFKDIVKQTLAVFPQNVP